ncbi:hypothetical protein Trydic_g22710 [Trypoxylus dichotomus]
MTELQAFVASKNIDIVLIQEPWIVKGKVDLTIWGWTLACGLDSNPRACWLVKRNLNFLMLRDHCSIDVTAVKIRWMHGSGTIDLLLGSLMSYAEVQKLELLLGCNANAHLVASGLVTLDRGNKPTFVTVSRASP